MVLHPSQANKNVTDLPCTATETLAPELYTTGLELAKDHPQVASGLGMSGLLLADSDTRKEARVREKE